jgi:TolB-like protein/Flp pilus assembly protein TadD/DNA-binding winged helix-turn-helix (wHTH) protein
LLTEPVAFELDDIQVDPDRNIIRRDGADIHIGDHAMTLLCLLASRPGRVVSRYELQHAISGHDPVPKNALSNCIEELREALDDLHEGRYIETVAGRGYRIVGVIHSESGHLPSDWLVNVPVQDGSKKLIQSFWQELQQRRVFRVAITYVIVVWALLQVIDIIFPLLGIPDWVMIMTFLVMLTGFPLALLLAWTLRWDADGIHYDSQFNQYRQRGFRRLSWGMVVLATALFSLLVWQSWEQLKLVEPATYRESTARSLEEEIPSNSIAVLRFANIGGAPEDEYFSDGLSEELLNVLARLREIKVSSRTSSWSLPQDMDVAAIRKRLRVGHVLEGSVRRSGDVVRITAQLINTENGYHLWSQTFDRRIEDILEVQDEVARQITDALKLLLSERSRAYLVESRVANVEAYDAYLLGLAELRKPLQPSVLNEAEQFFLRANQLEPGFAASWAGLCKARLRRYGFNRSVTDFEQAETACHRTLTLDDSSPGIFEALGELYMKSGQLDKAERSFWSALVLAPNSVDALLGLGKSLMRLGKLKEAEGYYKKAVELDVGYWKAQNALGSFYFIQGQADKATPYFKRVTLLAPDYANGYNNLGAAHMLSGNFDRALRAFEDAITLGPDRNTYSNAGTAQFMLRHFDVAVDMYQRAIELAPQNHDLWGNLGASLDQIDRKEKAQEAYVRAKELVEGLRNIDANDAGLMASSALYSARLNSPEEARKILAAIDSQANDMYVYYDMSLAFIALGDTRAALDALRNAVEAGYEASLIERDAGFDAIRSDHEYLALVRRIK